MDFLTGLNPSVIEDFKGANYRGESSDVRPPWLLRAQDVEFEEGFVRTRRGFYESPLRTVGQVVSGFYWYMLGPESYLYTARHSGGGVSVEFGKYNQAPSTFTARGADGLGAVFAGIGNRIYFAGFDPDYEEGTFGVHLDIDGSPTLPKVWMSPVTSGYVAAWTITPSTPAGVATVGTHNFALMFTSKTGFVTQRSPVSNLQAGAGLYDSILQMSLAAGTQAQIQITPTVGNPWPADAATVTLLATTVNNPFRYFIIPNQTFAITSPTATITFNLNISDAAMNLGTPFDSYENVIYEGRFSPGIQPIKPYYIFNCGERLGYFFRDPSFGYAIAFSAANNYEHVTMDRHIRYLPQRGKPIAAKWTQGSIYIFAENATYAFTDTGDDPVTWPQERTVDDKIGVNQPYALSLDTSGNGFVANRLGLYSFNGGVYSRTPLSYYVQEDMSGTFGSWSNINWNMASGNIVSVADDAENRRVLICSPANFPAVHVFNYLDGLSADRVRYSNLTIAGGIPNWVGIVQNNGDSHSSTRRQQLWMAPGAGKWLLNCPPDEAGGNAVRFKDTINGVDYPINSILWFPYLPERHQGISRQEHHYVQLRTKGSGTLTLELYGLDEILSLTGLTQSLSSSPGDDMYFGFTLISRAVTARISVVAIVGSWFSLSHFAHYWKPYANRR